MKKNKNKIIVISSIAVFLIAALTIYLTLFRQDADTNLTLVERQWVENNRSRVFDFGILNNIPVFSRDGQGVIFDFFNDFEEDVNLNFNKSSHRSTANIQSDYSFKVVNSKGDNDILVYQDHFVLISKDDQYNSLTEINNISVGVLDDFLTRANDSLKGASNVSFTAYGTIEEMLEAYNSDEDEESEIDYLILPLVQNLELIITNDDMNIAYNIYNMTQDYVITLGEEDRLNNILIKYFESWTESNFNDSYNINLASDYFLFSDVDSQERADFRSKRYVIGVIENPFYLEQLPFEAYQGFHFEFLNSFKNVADIEIEYVFYNNNEEILNAFNSNDIDFYYNNLRSVDYEMDVTETKSLFEDRFVVLSMVGNQYNVSNEVSLRNYNVYTVASSKIEEHLDSFDVEYHSFDNVYELLLNANNSDVIVIDYNTYNLLSKSQLNYYDTLYYGSSNSNNSYVFRDISANEVFNDFLTFYSSSSNVDNYKANVMGELIKVDPNNYFLSILNYFGYFLFLAIVGYFVNMKVKDIGKSKKKTITKSDKLKYIDMLTSLKNRNYLSENVESWDESEVYPQAIVVIDLNNLAYVNDNYGHQEGDKIIKEAANVLITTQIENSEIIRTDGNEFLVYLVGHDDKHISSYVKKLHRDLKNISHNFGAAIGYSMIENGIKTIDDAINEATIDMKKEKEELNN